MSIYVTGDTHGKPAERLEGADYLTADDTVIILGDVGVPWPHMIEENEQQLKRLSEMPCKIIFLLGNHDNYDWAETQYNGVSHIYYNNKPYKNIFVYWDVSIVEIEGKRILLIPGAESHDFREILDPADPDFQDRFNELMKSNTIFRVRGINWWEQEKVNIEAVENMASNPSVYGHFDYVLSHDFPGSINHIWKRYGTMFRLAPTDSQEALEKLREALDFDQWFHGHAHDPWMPWDHLDSRVHCIFEEWEELK